VNGLQRSMPAKLEQSRNPSPQPLSIHEETGIEPLKLIGGLRAQKRIWIARLSLGVIEGQKLNL